MKRYKILVKICVLFISVFSLSGCGSSSSINEYHQVIFWDTNSNSYSVEIVKDGDTVESQATPYLVDTNFIGWYSKSDVLFDFTKPINESIELYSIYEKNDYIGYVKKDNITYNCYENGEAYAIGSFWTYFTADMPSPETLILENEVEYLGETYKVTSVNLHLTPNTRKVIFPDNIKSLTNFRCSGVSNLKSISLGKDFQYSTFNFLEYIQLEEVIINPSNKYFKSIDGVVYNKDLSKIVYYPPAKSGDSFDINNKVKEIGEYCFSMSSLSNINIPSSVTKINSYAFYCSNISTISIPDSVTNFDIRSLLYCWNLEVINIGSGVKYIGTFLKGINTPYFSFEKLREINLSEGVQYIGSDAFFSINYGITPQCVINIPSTVNYISDNAFGVGCFKEVNISKSNEYYTCIDNVIYSKDQTVLHTYLNTKDDVEFDIPNSVTSIESYAFFGCTALTSITIPNSITSIEYSTFSGCTALTSITIPNSVTSIGCIAFSGCTALTSITIPNSVTSIESHVFFDCTALASITIPNSITSIESGAFSGCTALTSITIPNSVTSIESYAFSGCTTLTSITIPNSVTSIGSNAFSECTALTSITIPNSVTSIGSNAFSGCTALTSITIPNSVTSIEYSTFSGCTALASINIPNSITSIASSAFYGCTALTSIYIPNSVTNIESGPFLGCTSLIIYTSFTEKPDGWNYYWSYNCDVVWGYID
ncbi:MAG: leucine-rich repeat domain-containing protein [bacterium]